MTDSTTSPAFSIFRGASAPSLMDSGLFLLRPGSAAAGEAIEAEMADIADRGDIIRVPYSGPAMSLIHLWFKSGYTLPRHSHDKDCLYFIVAGSLRIGTADLGPGDGFFVGSGVPYTYTAGPEGAEVLEFRPGGGFHTDPLVPMSFWTKSAAMMRGRQDAWANERQSPSGMIACPLQES